MSVAAFLGTVSKSVRPHLGCPYLCEIVVSFLRYNWTIKVVSRDAARRCPQRLQQMLRALVVEGEAIRAYGEWVRWRLWEENNDDDGLSLFDRQETFAELIASSEAFLRPLNRDPLFCPDLHGHESWFRAAIPRPLSLLPRIRRRFDSLVLAAASKPLATWFEPGFHSLEQDAQQRQKEFLEASIWTSHFIFDADSGRAVVHDGGTLTGEPNTAEDRCLWFAAVLADVLSPDLYSSTDFVGDVIPETELGCFTVRVAKLS